MENIPLALTYDDVLLVPQRSSVQSRSQISLKTQITPNFSVDFPIISINMETVTGIDMAVKLSQLGGVSFYPRFKSPQEQVKDIQKIHKAGARVIPAVGIKDGEFERVSLLADIGVEVITIDVAHGHLQTALDFVKKIKKKYPQMEVISGVVGTYEGARDLFEVGADAVRVGVGPGTICTTRKVTGSGVPQITAISDAYRAGKEFGKPIIADGGTKNTGDIVKALAAGANAVAIGSQLAGTDEAPGSLIEIAGKKYKEYNGSTSKTEKIKQYAQYNQDKTEAYVEYVEGVESTVPYTGTLETTIQKMDKGIRSGLSYSGAFNIAELHEKAKFIRITQASIAENGAHGVLLT